MSKKRRGSTSAKNSAENKLLTGGSNDVNPQLLRLTLSTTTNGTVNDEVAGGTWLYYSMPLPPFYSADKPYLIEVLKVRWGMRNPNVNTGNAEGQKLGTITAVLYQGLLSGDLAPDIPPADPFQISRHTEGTWYATGGGVMTGFLRDTSPMTDDLTDGAGHGFLVANQQLAISVQWSNVMGGIPYTISCWILYRYKEVDLGEYLGILQSQMGAVPTGTAQ